MAESYQDIMSRLNGGQQAPQPPKAATDFATYVRTLLANPNPQGGMMGDAAGYYADPFRKQNAINQAILDEELRKKKEAEDAAAAAGVGMFGGSSSGGSDSGNNVQLTKEQLEFLENETLDQRGERLQRDWLGLKPIAGMLIDPLNTFLTYPKQEPAPVRVATGKTPYQIFMENWEKTLPADIQVMRNIGKAQNETAAALANSGWNPEGTQYTSSYGTTTDSGNISAAAASGLESARESFGYGSNADYYGD